MNMLAVLKLYKLPNTYLSSFLVEIENMINIWQTVKKNRKNIYVQYSKYQNHQKIDDKGETFL